MSSFVGQEQQQPPQTNLTHDLPNSTHLISIRDNYTYRPGIVRSQT